MASKRMFHIKIVDSDAFLDLPFSAQALYFHLNMRADDDGFLGNAKRIYSYIGVQKKDFDVLVEKRFVIKVKDVYVIKHWRLHNTIFGDRYKPTTYQEEYKLLTIKENRAYTERKQNVNKYDAKIVNSDNNNNVDVCVSQNVSLDIDRDLDGDLDKDINVHSGEMHDTDSEPLEQFYESIWKLYPLKKGKGQVSKTKKQVLQRIGYEQIKRCVERYVAEIKSSGKEKYMMHGSTFFNSGYVDYLDGNYEDSGQPVEPVKEGGVEDRFSCLEPDMRSLLEGCGVIDGQSLSLGNATDEQIKYLQDCGVL